MYLEESMKKSIRHDHGDQVLNREVRRVIKNYRAGQTIDLPSLILDLSEIGSPSSTKAAKQKIHSTYLIATVLYERGEFSKCAEITLSAIDIADNFDLCDWLYDLVILQARALWNSGLRQEAADWLRKWTSSNEFDVCRTDELVRISSCFQIALSEQANVASSEQTSREFEIFEETFLGPAMAYQGKWSRSWKERKALGGTDRVPIDNKPVNKRRAHWSTLLKKHR